MTTMLPLSSIIADQDLQTRAETDYRLAGEYGEDMRRGAKFPPVVVFYDGKSYWLVEGFHRRLGAELATIPEIEADVRQGSRRDAIIFGLGANSAHGLRRTNADKRRIVMRAFDLDEGWSDREVAKRCAVSHNFVAELHRERDAMTVTGLQSSDKKPRRVNDRWGNEITMNTAGINADRPRRERPAGGDDDRSWSPSDIPKPSPEPERPVPDSPLWQDRDHDKDWIGTTIRQVCEAIERLPSPEEASRDLQFHQALKMEPARLRAVTEWFARFTELREEQEPKRRRRYGKMYNREVA